MLDYQFQDLKDKIEKLCNENGLEFTFESSQFPIIATIRPIKEECLNE